MTNTILLKQISQRLNIGLIYSFRFIRGIRRRQTAADKPRFFKRQGIIENLMLADPIFEVIAIKPMKSLSYRDAMDRLISQSSLFGAAHNRDKIGKGCKIPYFSA